MKKKISIALFLILTFAVVVGAWFYGYYNRKSNDNLPSLDTIAEMDEADVNTLLMGYQRIQLIEVWGEPDNVQENEDIWKINDTISLRVNSNNKGKVVICGLIGSSQLSNKEFIVGGDLIPMVMVNGELYLDTGHEASSERKCGTMDGEITSAVDGTEKPTKDNQSNFGTGYGYQYGSHEGLIEIYMNDKWWVFATEKALASSQIMIETNETETITFQNKVFIKSELSEETLEWLENYNSLSEEEQLAISYIPAELYELCGYPTAEETEAPIE